MFATPRATLALIAWICMVSKSRIAIKHTRVRTGQVLRCEESSELWIVVRQTGTGSLRDLYGDAIYGCKAVDRDDECIVFASQLGRRFTPVGSVGASPLR